MNNEVFQQARASYARKDYEGALAAYTRCLQDAGHPLAPGELGLLYHKIGGSSARTRTKPSMLTRRQRPTRPTMRAGR